MSWSLPAKALVILSSLTLGCTYVAYRQKQSEPPPAPASPRTTASSKPKPKNPDRVTVLPGSKSIDAVLRNPAGSGSDSIDPVEPAAEKATSDKFASDALLHSSKSGRIFSTPPGNPSSKTDDAEEKKRTLLPSSKIGPILSPDDAPATNRKQLDETQKPQEEDGAKK